MTVYLVILSIFINLYMFQATMCTSSGETTVFMCGMTVWYAPYIPDSHPHRITNTKCQKNTVVFPDCRHIVTRNMQRLINILRINCPPSWLYLQDCTGMHGQQSIKKKDSLCLLGCYTTLNGKQFEGTIILHNIRYYILHTMV